MKLHTSYGVVRDYCAIGALAFVSSCGIASSQDTPEELRCANVTISGSGPSCSIPESSLLNETTRAILDRKPDPPTDEWKACTSNNGAHSPSISDVRECEAKAFYRTPTYQYLRAHYNVLITSEAIGRVPTETFTPSEGVARANRDRVLINLHGGGFWEGSRIISQIESIPVASVGKIKVISIDYRMKPEYSFPAASEDVEAVYRELIRTYDPKNIGIYGCSAGGLLTAEAIAWFRSKNMPLPGAIGMFCGAGSYWSDGDSGHIIALFGLQPKARDDDHYFAYFKNVDANDPLAFPVKSMKVMSSFPPSLLISSTRDLALSSVVYTHSILVQQGVPAELHVWEGLGHAFFYDARLPQSQEVYDVTTRFFQKYLGRAPRDSVPPQEVGTK